MTKARFIPSFLLVFMIMMLSVSCKRDCSKTVCGYNQTCSDGNCFCRNGFEGDSCNKLSYPKYIGINYIASDNCSGNNSYSVYITQNDSYDPSHLVINNLFGFYQVDAYIKSSSDKKGNYLYIPSQVIGSIEITGQGPYELYSNRARITLNFSYNQSGSDKACTVTLYQQ